MSPSDNKRTSQSSLPEDVETPVERIQLQDDGSKLRATSEINTVVTSYLQGEDGLQLPEELQKEEDYMYVRILSNHLSLLISLLVTQLVHVPVVRSSRGRIAQIATLMAVRLRCR